MKHFALLIIAMTVSTSSLAQQKLVLALNWKAEPQFGGFYEASLKQEFKKMGVDLVVQEGGSGTPTVQMLANKQVELAVVSAEEILINNDKNPDRKLLAIFASFQTNPQIIMCRPESHFKSLTEVMNSSATLSLQSGLSYAQFLKKKYPAAKVKWVPYLGGITNFLNDKNFCQQGFYTSEPLLAQAKGISPDVFLVSQEGFNPYTTVVAIRAQDSTKMPIDRIIAALRTSWENYLINPDTTNAAMAKLNKSMEPTTFRDSALAQVKLIRIETEKSFKIGQMNLTRWQQLIQQMQDIGLVKGALKANEQFYGWDQILL